MRCPTLSELPSPPPGKTGWPWTEESPQLPELMRDDSPWPRISIVTPSFNQGQFIEETIRSVLLQGYPNLEYIIIDGGSTDRSFDIIKKYEPWLTYCVSEKDRGQSHAINKGFAKCNGHIMGWLCSDDVYSVHSFSRVANMLLEFHWSLLVGATRIIGQDGEDVGPTIFKPLSFHNLWVEGKYTFAQTSVFWKKALWDEVGGLNESFHYVMDYELWLRMVLYANGILMTRQVLSYTRLQPKMKTQEKFRLLISAEKERARTTAARAVQLTRLGLMLLTWQSRISKIHIQGSILSKLKNTFPKWRELKVLFMK